LSVVHFAAHADRILPAIVAPNLKAGFQLTDAQLGLLLGPAFVLAFVAATLVVGPYADRLPRYRLLAFSVLGWSLACIGFGLAGRFEHLVGARLALGLGQALLAPTALSLILQRAPVAKAGRAIALFTSGATLGRSSAFLAGGAILAALAWAPTPDDVQAATSSWRWLFLISALPNLLLAAALFRRAEPVLTAAEGLRSGSVADWLRHTPAVWLHLSISGAALLLAQSVAVWGPSVFGRSTGLGPAVSAIWTGCAVLLGAPIGHAVGGHLVDQARKARRPPTVALAASLVTTIPAALLLGLVEGPLPLALALLVLTVCVGAAAVAALAGFQPLVPLRLRGRGNALYFATISLVGLGLGPPLVGLVSDRLGESSGGLTLALAGTVAAVALPAAIASVLSGKAWSVAAQAATSSPHAGGDQAA
jgi:MFS family permease